MRLCGMRVPLGINAMFPEPNACVCPRLGQRLAIAFPDTARPVLRLACETLACLAVVCLL